MPPALVEDGEAATVEEGEESAIGRFLWSLVPGSSLVDAYRDYQKGSYVSAGLNGISGLSDLLSLGAITKAKSSLKLLVGFMKVRVKDALADEAANQAGIAVAERLGPEAGFVTQIIVSATLSKNVSQQNKTQLGFASDVTPSSFWTKTKTFKGYKVLQRDDLIDPKLVDVRGRTNLTRMRTGYAPIGPDGNPIHLHHTIQDRNGAIAEVTQTFHQKNSKAIHINIPSNKFPSGIDRTAFNTWKDSYWKDRANDFGV